MSLRGVATEAAVLVVAITVAASFGYAHGFDRATQQANDKVIQADARTHRAKAEATASATALADIKRLLDQQRSSAETARKIADQALRERDATNAKLASAVRQRQDAERKAAHENPECTDLVRVPLCPAVARRLFQPGNEDRTGATVSH